ncbi:hypothetical protein BLOT_005915 [Blomia tropicalis]|nr:hypothetical protein BLOT_005915 [Blomia tropicalis]
MFSFLEKNKFLLLTLATLGFKFICFLLTKIIIRIFVALFFRKKRFKWFNDGNQWAVITGATDGIGYEMSQQLAFKGYNLMLIGRNENKLEQTKLKILQNISICAQEKNKLNKNVKTMSSVQIRTMVFDFSTSIDYSSIEHFVQSNLHDIFILVNNVGTSLTIPQRFVEECPISHEEIIHVNIIAATKMIELILSSMINRKRGLVINAYVSTLSNCLAEEYRNDGLAIVALYPWRVSTKMTAYHKIDFSTPNPCDYVRSALMSIKHCGGTEITGYWSHSFIDSLFNMVSSFGGKQITIRWVKSIITKYRRRVIEMMQELNSFNLV